MRWTKDMLEYLKTLTGVNSYDAAQLVSDRFGININRYQVKACRKNHHINSGLTGHFEKGHTPFTKGKKWDEFMSYAGQANSRKNVFKKGNVPHNYDPVGTIKKKADGYLWKKIADPDEWRQLHILLWEEQKGNYTPDKKVAFLDGNRNHVEIDNLILVDNGVYQTYKKFKPGELASELRPVAIEVCKLEYAIRRKLKK